jgi:hypothetical protein
MLGTAVARLQAFAAQRPAHLHKAGRNAPRAVASFPPLQPERDPSARPMLGRVSRGSDREWAKDPCGAAGAGELATREAILAQAGSVILAQSSKMLVG